jgi:membrane-associated protease RseP (regulator of RpoE activity)
LDIFYRDLIALFIEPRLCLKVVTEEVLMRLFTIYGLSSFWIASLTGVIAQAYSDQKQMISQDGGIGVVISMGDYGLQIFDVFYNSPAAAAGLASGDYIWAIDGEETINWDLAQAVDAIRGEIGTTVTLTIRRSGAELIIPLVRQLIGQPAGYVRTPVGHWGPTN